MFSTYTSFTHLFLERFSEREENAATHHEMTHLKQGSMTVDEFITRFEELEYLTNYNDVAHIQEFKESVIRKSSTSLSTRSPPLSL